MDHSPDYSVVPLSKIIDSLPEDELITWLRSFRAYKDSETESFLRDKAIEMEKRELSRTFLAVDSKWEILGYVTLGIKCTRIPAGTELSRKMKQMMNIEKRTGIAQSYLLGQLSRSVNSPSGFGKAMVKEAFKELRAANEKVGCRLVRLDCHDELVPYYNQIGFKYIRVNESNTLNQMVAFL